jgi:hypothetical protein
MNRNLLNQAVGKGILSEAQAAQLWDFISAQTADAPRFQASHILYYFGGMIAIGAMSLFMNLGWEHFGGWGIFFLALVYMGAGLALTRYFLNTLRLAIPAGITAAFVVVLVPLAIYGLQHALGLWPKAIDAYRDYHRIIDWRWMLMEFGTLAAGAIMLWKFRLPFLMMPIAITLWYMSMDIVPFVFGVEDAKWELRKLVSVYFGLLIALLGFWVDIRSRFSKDFSFWLYVVGVVTFWGALSMMNSDSELNKFVYFCINLAMIAIGAALSRRVFVIFGALGVAGYVGHLASSIFRDSILFPIALTAIGMAVIYCGILWQRHETAIGARLRSALPAALRELVEART